MGRTCYTCRMAEQNWLIIDIETHAGDLMYDMPPEQFFRLGGYLAPGTDDVRITTSLSEMRERIEAADLVIGHNIIEFDLPALFGRDSLVPMHLADAGKIFDTYVYSVLVNPAPYVYTDYTGKRRLADTPAKARAWHGLNQVAHTLGVSGKVDSATELALEWGDPSLPKAERIRDGFGKIPLDDPRFVAYLIGDVRASEAVARAMLRRWPMTPYARRDQRVEARAARISANGFRVDIAEAERQVAEQDARKAALLASLAPYGFPTGGAMPWRTNAGKAAVWALLAAHGVTPGTDWPRTKGGALSLAGDALTAGTAGTPAAEIGRTLAELQGQRSGAQLALETVRGDGFVHPDITRIQASGRWSTTKPGLTVYSERADSRVQKKCYIPDSPDHVLIALDFQAADARVVAALSGDRGYADLFTDDREVLARLTGDPNFADLFEGSAGVHAINAVRAYGSQVVRTDPKKYRTIAKQLGHAWNYRAGVETLMRTSKLPREMVEQFCNGMARAYPGLVRWQARCSAEGERGSVRNLWGRVMRVDPSRAHTQAPALHGQSGTCEIICDALLRMDDELIMCVKAQIHDELLASVPRDRVDEFRSRFIEVMQTTINPPGGLEMSFPVSSGPAAENWMEASH